MSIWGKVIGGVAGFALGGPIGALLGAAVGHGVDKMRGEAIGNDGYAGTGPGTGFQEHDQESRQMAFTVAVIALAAKLAKVDGRVTRDEIAAFKSVFKIPPDEVDSVGKLFNKAKSDPTGFEPYADQIARIFARDPAMLEELLGALLHIAHADGEYHPNEKEYLQRVAAIFGFGPAAFERLEATFIQGKDADDPYEVMGVDRSISDEDLKTEYRRLMRENHPDRMVAEGLPPEMIELSNEKVAAINAAYDKICKIRGIK